MAGHTAGLAIGAILLAIGLVLVLLPQSFNGGPLTDSYDQFNLVNSNSTGLATALVNIPIPSASLSLGAASLVVSYKVTNGSAPVYVFLYTQSEGQEIYAGGASAQGALATGQSTQSTISLNSAQPGSTYALIVRENISTPETISVSWSGSLQFPYALIGLPLVVVGGIVLVGVVASMPARAEGRAGRVEVEEYGPAYDYSTPAVVISAPPPSTIPPPHVGVYPSSATSASPSAATTAPALSPRPPVTAPSLATAAASTTTPRHHFWRPTPLPASSTHPAADNDRVTVPAAQTPLASTGKPAAESPLPSAAPAAGAPGTGVRCPKCGLAIGDESWVFCPQCRSELD